VLYSIFNTLSNFFILYKYFLINRSHCFDQLIVPSIIFNCGVRKKHTQNKTSNKTNEFEKTTFAHLLTEKPSEKPISVLQNRVGFTIQKT
jgi:hypothetical protein